MTISATPPTTPPAMAPVFELPSPEDDGPEGVAVREDENEEVIAGKPVADGVIVPGGLVVEELDPSINTPGPISGLSKRRRYEMSKEKTGEDSYHRWSSLSICSKDQNHRASVCDEHVSERVDINSL